MNINWKQKLTSRKFWVAVVGFVTPVLIALNVDSLTSEKIIAVIAGAAVLIAYIVGEGLVDASRAENEAIKQEIEADAESIKGEIE